MSSSNKPKTITVKDLKNLKNAEEAFSIKERIGAGTYGEVFTAIHKDKAKMVAIKAMNLQPDEVHEIVSEVNTLSQYSDHNNIARYFGCYIKRGPVAQIWIAMEFCAGGSIFDLIKHGGNNGKHYFKEDWIGYASREILEGLKFLHSMKVIHRDIKGQNILLTDKAEVKLGHSRKLQRDLILRPDEGSNLEDSDEDNPETIKTIREQFKKMTDKPSFVPQQAQPQVVSSQVSHVAAPFHNRMNSPSAAQAPQNMKRHDAGVDINIRKMYEQQHNREDRRYSQKHQNPHPLQTQNSSPAGVQQPPAPARSTSQHNGFGAPLNPESSGAHAGPRSNDDHASKNQNLSSKGAAAESNGNNDGNSPPNWRPALVTNAVIEDHLKDLASHLAESGNEGRMTELEYLKRRATGAHLKQASEPAAAGYNRQSSEPIDSKNNNKLKGKILPDRIPFDCMKSSFMPTPSTNQSPTSSSNNNPIDVTNGKSNVNLDASDRKLSAPLFNGNSPAVLSTPSQSKEEVTRKISNGHKPPFPLSTSTSSENNRAQDSKAHDANKRNSKNFENVVSTDLDKSSTPASAVHANAPVRRNQNDPTPELPRKAQPIQVTTKVDQNPRKFSEPVSRQPLSKAPDKSRKFSEQPEPITRPSSAVKDLRQHPISRQNAPLSRNATASSIAGSMSDRPLPAQPAKSSVGSHSSISTPLKHSNHPSQRQSVSVMETSTESSSKGVWSRSSRNGSNDVHSSSSAMAMPLKVENIEHSPGARRKSYANRSEELQPKIDSSGYAQLRLEGSVTETSSTDIDRDSRNRKVSGSNHQQQPSFPFVDSDQDSTLNKPSTVKRSNYTFEDSFTSAFNNSYSNSEEERRKVMRSQNAEHSPNLSSQPSQGIPVSRDDESQRNHRHPGGVSNHQQHVSDHRGRDPVKHWQRAPASTSNSVSNSEYGNSAAINSSRQHLLETSQQLQVKSKGAVNNPDYGTNMSSNAVSNDQYGVSSSSNQDLANRRKLDDVRKVKSSIALSNLAYDVNQTTASGMDSDYESLVGPSKAKEVQNPIYTNQLEVVPEVGQGRQQQRQSKTSGFDDSGVYAQFDADAHAYEVLYPPQARESSPKPMPRSNMSVSRERLRSSQSDDVSKVTTKASLVAARSLTPSGSHENMSNSGMSSASESKNPSSSNLHCSVGSESSVSLADDLEQSGKEEDPIEDELSDDSDKEQADRFGTILVSSKPKPIQSEVSSKLLREDKSGGKDRDKRQMHRLSMGECSSSGGSIKSTKSSNIPPSNSQNNNNSPPQKEQGKENLQGASDSYNESAAQMRGQHKKSSSRSMSQERPMSQMSKKASAVDIDITSSSSPSAAQSQTPSGKDGSSSQQNVSEKKNSSSSNLLRKHKESKTRRSMEDVSNKRASMVSVPSQQNMDSRLGTPDSKQTPPSETPRKASEGKLKRQSTAEVNTSSPHSRSRKGSSSDTKAGHFNSFGFGVGGSTPSSVNVPINISSSEQGSTTSPINPEIRKFLKKFKSEVLCACLWGVNLLIGTTKGLYFMDRSGGCEVVRLVSDRKFSQMEIIPSLSLLVTISGKNNRLREYYLKVLHSKIIKQDTPKVHDEYGDIGNKIEHCNSFKIVKYDAIRFLVVAYKTGIIVLAWAPKPCHKFMAVTEYKELKGEPLFVNVAIREAESGGKFVLKVVYATSLGFHVVDDSGSQDIFIPTAYGSDSIRPHCIMTFPKSDEPAFLLCYNSEGAYVTDEGKFFRDAFLQWGEAPITSVAAVGSSHIMGWAPSAIEFRSLTTGQLDGVFMQRNTFKMRFLCECNDKVFFSSHSKSGVSQIYLLTLNHQSMIGSK